LLDAITLSVFLTVGGHRHLMRALLDTFYWRPPGVNDLPTNVVDVLTAVTGESFLVGIRAGAPVMVALILAVLILGMISRTVPQLNILAVGFSLNAIVMLSTLSFSIGAVAWLLQERSEAVVDAVHKALIEP
jgi:flagellar biosynthetic protein FliR